MSDRTLEHGNFKIMRLLRHRAEKAEATIKSLESQIEELKQGKKYLNKQLTAADGINKRQADQIKEYDKELNYLEWRTSSDGAVEHFAGHAGKARKRIAAMTGEDDE